MEQGRSNSERWGGEEGLFGESCGQVGGQPGAHSLRWGARGVLIPFLAVSREGKTLHMGGQLGVADVAPQKT